MPLNAFIIRPFGIKEITISAKARPETSKEVDKVEICKSHSPGAEKVSVAKRVEAEGVIEQVSLNFDWVEGELILPALEKLRIYGATTGAFVAAGNIREDMFHRLMTADLVIADVSYHNPNVFYELGVRQAFRDKYTLVMRCNVSPYPFDLQTDRYFEYEWKNPRASLDALVEALRATLSSDKADSPVFKLLPKLEAEDRARFINVPQDFREEVERARKSRRGGDLRMLAAEVEGYLWEIEGLREIGRAQFELNFIPGAKTTWESILHRYPDDIEANTILSTIYQRLNDATRSEQALARLSRHPTLTAGKLSEVRALQGRNLKARWIEDWKSDKNRPEKNDADRNGTDKEEWEKNTSKARKQRWQEDALRSPLLQRAIDAYEEAFSADMNNPYAGLNALTLLIIQTDLAERYPDIWKGIQKRPEDAPRDLGDKKRRIRKLISAMELSVEAERARLKREDRIDFWFEILEATMECITSEQPERVAQTYRDAMIWAPQYAEQSMRKALQMYEDLDIGPIQYVGMGSMKQNIKKALEVIREGEERKGSGKRKRILLFYGLRLDDEQQPYSKLAERNGGRPPRHRNVRFPAEKEPIAKQAIKEAIERELDLLGPDDEILFGMAGGSNGGDILFHEVFEETQKSKEKNRKTLMFLPLPKEQFIGEFVAPAGEHWVERFLRLYREREKRGEERRADFKSRHGAGDLNILAEFKELPRWLQGKPLYNVNRRNNIWMMQHALVASALNDDAEITMIALTDDDSQAEKDGIGGDQKGKGGISDMIKLAHRYGIKVSVIHLDRLRDSPGVLDKDKDPSKQLLRPAPTVATVPRA